MLGDICTCNYELQLLLIPAQLGCPELFTPKAPSLRSKACAFCNGPLNDVCLSLCAYKSLSQTQVSLVFRVSCFFFQIFYRSFDCIFSKH